MAAVVAVTGFVVLVVVGGSFGGGGETARGGLLAGSFREAAVLIPLFLFAISAGLYSGTIRPRHLAAVAVLTPILLPLGAALRLFSAAAETPVTHWIADSFGTGPGGLLCLLVAVIVCLLAALVGLEPPSASRRTNQGPRAADTPEPVSGRQGADESRAAAAAEADQPDAPAIVASLESFRRILSAHEPVPGPTDDDLALVSDSGDETFASPPEAPSGLPAPEGSAEPAEPEAVAESPQVPSEATPAQRASLPDVHVLEEVGTIDLSEGTGDEPGGAGWPPPGRYDSQPAADEDREAPPAEQGPVDEAEPRPAVELDEEPLVAGPPEVQNEAGTLLASIEQNEVPPTAEGRSPSSPPRAAVDYYVPVEDLLRDYGAQDYGRIDAATERAGEILTNTLREFNIDAQVTGICKGPVITMFEILPAPGVKISSIVNLADNIALRLAASRVRIVAPIPGKHAVGIEVPNAHRSIVGFREMICLDEFRNSKAAVPVVLGKDVAGAGVVADLTQTPHLLIAGATGSGKSVCVNSIICSIIATKRPDEVRLLLIDPKIVELKFYNDVPHLLTPVITDPKRAFQALQYCVFEMERRYSMLDALGVRDLPSFNAKAKRTANFTPLPYIVIIVDEFADLMATTGKELEATLARLAAMSRAVGIHIILATQRPSIDVITGLIKANIPSRIAFMVAGKFDSRIIIDAVGAEKLLGRGDMLFQPSWDPTPLRIQGAFLTEDEVESIAGYVKTLGRPDYIDDDILFDEEDGEGYFADGDPDPLMEQALDVVVTAGKASASYLQRKLKIGYNRAARLVEEMEERGIVGPANGSKPREIFHIPSRSR